MSQPRTSKGRGPELSTGILLSPQLRLVRPLAEGGMGTVWVAYHLVLARQVAVKLMSADLDHPDALRRFQREATTTANIKSPHVVQIFDLGATTDGTPFMAMELLEGETLAERIDRDGALGLQPTADIVLQLGRAFGAAHKAGIVHRDVKPENVFLQRNDDSAFVKVLDFGVAKVEAPKAGRRAITSAGVALGSPAYMSPEQMVDASTVDFHADLWAVAVCTYEMLTGQVPFQGESYPSVCAAVMNGQFLPPSELCAHALPDGMDAWFERAFHKAPARRFESARDLAMSFVALLPEHDIDDRFSESGRFRLSHSGRYSMASLVPESKRATTAATAAADEPTLEVSTVDVAELDEATTVAPSAPPPRVPVRELSTRRRPRARTAVLVAAVLVPLGAASVVVADRVMRAPAVQPAPTAAATPPAPAETAVAPANSASAAEPVPLPAPVAPTATVAPDPKAAAAAWRERVTPALQLSRWDDAVAGVEAVAHLDPGFAAQERYHPELLDLTVKAALVGGDTERRMLEVLSAGAHEHGVDLLFEVIVRWGGSRAANRAADLLAREEVRGRGSPAMRVAYDLRTATSCQARHELLGRVAAEGDHRALRELKSSAAGDCPDLTRDAAYASARRAVLERRREAPAAR
jgi:serine/threonine-protein kinase